MMDIVFNKNEYYIRHECSTSGGSSGSPIILLNNSKVIGIHLYHPNDNHFIKKEYNEGNFIFEAADSFKKEYSVRLDRQKKTIISIKKK